MKLDNASKTQVAAVLEALLSDGHPMHETARAMAVEFVDAYQAEKLEWARQRMQQQIDDGFDLTPWTR